MDAKVATNDDDSIPIEQAIQELLGAKDTQDRIKAVGKVHHIMNKKERRWETRLHDLEQYVRVLADTVKEVRAAQGDPNEKWRFLRNIVRFIDGLLNRYLGK